MITTLDSANAALRDAVNARLASKVETDSLRPVTEPMPFATSDEVPYQQDIHEHHLHRAGMTQDELDEALERLAGDGITHEQQPGSLPFLELLEELRTLHYEKTASYGGATDPFENVTASARCGVEPWRRALCDLSDCVVRMQKYANGQPVDYENALIDAANWSLICLLKLREAKRA